MDGLQFLTAPVPVQHAHGLHAHGVAADHVMEPVSHHQRMGHIRARLLKGITQHIDLVVAGPVQLGTGYKGEVTAQLEMVRIGGRTPPASM